MLTVQYINYNFNLEYVKNILMAFLLLILELPTEIEAQGQRAQLAYKRALREGYVNVYRSRVLLIGQDRAGKTSLKKSLMGLPFDPKEQSTEGIEVDPSTFEVDVDQVKNWQSVDKNKQGLLGCCKGDVAKMVVEKLHTVTGGDDSDNESSWADDDDDEEMDEDKKDNEGKDSLMDQVCNYYS